MGQYYNFAFGNVKTGNVTFCRDMRKCFELANSMAHGTAFAFDMYLSSNAKQKVYALIGDYNEVIWPWDQFIENARSTNFNKRLEIISQNQDLFFSETPLYEIVRQYKLPIRMVAMDSKFPYALYNPFTFEFVDIYNTFNKFVARRYRNVTECLRNRIAWSYAGCVSAFMFSFSSDGGGGDLSTCQYMTSVPTGEWFNPGFWAFTRAIAITQKRHYNSLIALSRENKVRDVTFVTLHEVGEVILDTSKLSEDNEYIAHKLRMFIKGMHIKPNAAMIKAARTGMREIVEMLNSIAPDVQDVRDAIIPRLVTSVLKDLRIKKFSPEYGMVKGYLYHWVANHRKLSLLDELIEVLMNYLKHMDKQHLADKLVTAMEEQGYTTISNIL